MENEIKKVLEVLESRLKNDGYGIRVFWNDDKQHGLSASNYETRILERADESGKSKVVDLLKFDLLESFYRFAKNGPTTHVSERQPSLSQPGMFDDVKEIADFHKTFRKFSLNKEVDFYSEDGQDLTVQVVEVRDFKTNKECDRILTEIKAQNITELIEKLKAYVSERVKEENKLRENRSAASEWGSNE